MVSSAVPGRARTKAQVKVIHATIKKVGEDIETLCFNTAIAQMMIFVNAFTNANCAPSARCARCSCCSTPLRRT